jgi:hypothetical protein
LNNNTGPIGSPHAAPIGSSHAEKLVHTFCVSSLENENFMTMRRKSFKENLYTTAQSRDGGSGYAAILAHAGGALYGMELGSVTLKRIGFFCFPIKHSTHTHAGGALYGTELGSVTLKRIGFFVFQLNTQHTRRS